jgi:hypothetical protein
MENLITVFMCIVVICTCIFAFASILAFIFNDASKKTDVYKRENRDLITNSNLTNSDFKSIVTENTTEELIHKSIPKPKRVYKKKAKE